MRLISFLLLNPFFSNHSAKLFSVKVAVCIASHLSFLPFAVPAVFNCASGSVECLINSINVANANGEPDTINLQGGVYKLISPAEPNDDGPNGLPSITSEIKILGNGPTTTVIERDPTLGESFDSQFRIVHVGEEGNLALDGLAIRRGFGFDSTLDGPGVFNRGTATISNAIISKNATVFGSGTVLNIGAMIVTDSIIAENDIIEGVGGGLANAGISTVKNSTIRNNSADSGGGGVANDGYMTILNSTIGDNITFLSGGGGIANGGNLILSNSTIANNIAQFEGGGISNFFGNVVVTNSTIANNLSDAGIPPLIESAGGGVDNTGGTFELQNSIVALNNSTAEGPDCAGLITSRGANLIGDISGCDVTLQAGDLIGDPGLAAFIDDDEPGKSHFPLLAASPAIDSANPEACPETDQLGNPRIGICDIGAVEFTGSLLVTIDVSKKLNLKSNMKFDVVILSANGFDATTVDPNTVRFGATGTEASPRRVSIKDLDRDRDRDMILRFQIRDLGIECRDTSASLTAKTFSGLSIIASSPIETVKCDKLRDNIPMRSSKALDLKRRHH